MKYDIWFRRHTDGRAPEYVALDSEYRKTGAVESVGRSGIVRAVLDKKDQLGDEARALRVGDVAVDEEGQAWIYTIYGQWAQVRQVVSPDVG